MSASPSRISQRLPRIKICGVTRSEDLVLIQQAGADCVGFNFVTTSSRYVDPTVAAELCAVARRLGLTSVAVVMDPSVDELTDLLNRVSVDFVQLHGQESIEIASACDGKPIIKATSWSGRAEEAALVSQWLQCPELRAWLVDAYAPVVGGGTGKVADWSRLKPKPAEFGPQPILLAGGLTEHNVADAIAATNAFGVDTASGVESAPGKKDACRVTAFTAAAREQLTL